MTVKIMTDSSVTIEPELVEELGITIVPITITIDGVIYQDTDLVLDDYMVKMKLAKKLPKTSQPPIGIFEDTFNKLGADGSQILGIFLSDSLSGTVDAARQGGAISSQDVTILDSTFTDQAMKFQVVEAAKLAKQGASLAEILRAVEDVRQNTELYIGVSSLENLVKGGRISRATGLVGSMLNIRVILEMKDKTLYTLKRGRGPRAFQKWLDEFSEKLSESGRKVREIGVSHAENFEFALVLKEGLQKFVQRPIPILNTSSVIATHTGPGAWAVLINYE